MKTDGQTKISDAWLRKVLTPDRHVRDYYADSDDGRMIIRLTQRNAPQLIFNGTFLRTVKTRGDVRFVARALKVELKTQ